MSPFICRMRSRRYVSAAVAKCLCCSTSVPANAIESVRTAINGAVAGRASCRSPDA